MLGLLKRLLEEGDGQGLVEYALIISLFSILMVGSLTLFKDQLINTYDYIRTSLP